MIRWVLACEVTIPGPPVAKGRYGYGFVDHPDRLTTPLVRKDGGLVPVSWEEAIGCVAEPLQHRSLLPAPGGGGGQRDVAVVVGGHV